MRKAILTLILEVLYRALRVLERRDVSVAQELNQLPRARACASARR